MVSAIAPDGSASEALEALLAPFTEVSRQLLKQRELLRRIDSKYVVHASRVSELMGALRTGYAVLRVPTGSCATYRSLYFDTPELRCFHDHRRGRRIRHKIRIRHYPERAVSFLEVKTKRNELVTDKHRLAMPFEEEHLGERELAFLRPHIGEIADDLPPLLRIDYRRITLINLDANERVTIDLELEIAALDGTRHSLGPLAVMEIKQGAFSLDSPVMRALSAAGQHQRSLSKYCAAVALLHPEERKNRLLPSLRAVERIVR
jgi:hypothetical protein